MSILIESIINKKKWKPFNKIFEGAFIVFLCLKLASVIDWSWWWATAPIWGGFLINLTTNYIYCRRYGLPDDRP